MCFTMAGDCRSSDAVKVSIFKKTPPRAEGSCRVFCRRLVEVQTFNRSTGVIRRCGHPLSQSVKPQRLIGGWYVQWCAGFAVAHAARAPLFAVRGSHKWEDGLKCSLSHRAPPEPNRDPCQRHSTARISNFSAGIVASQLPRSTEIGSSRSVALRQRPLHQLVSGSVHWMPHWNCCFVRIRAGKSREPSSDDRYPALACVNSPCPV